MRGCGSCWRGDRRGCGKDFKRTEEETARGSGGMAVEKAIRKVGLLALEEAVGDTVRDCKN